MLSILQWQILITVFYCRIFDYVLTKKELEKRLVSENFVKKLDINFQSSKRNLDSEIKQLIKKNLLFNQDDYYLLDPSDSKLIKLRAKRKKFLVIQKKKELMSLIRLGRQCRWISAIAITGAASMQNSSNQEDDLDLFVITQPNRLWLTRIYVLIYSVLKKKKISMFSKKLIWDFNLWMDSHCLAVPDKYFSLYSAYEVVQTVFFYDSDHLKEKFYQQNAWIKKYLSNYNYSDNNMSKPQKHKSNNIIKDIFNYLSYIIQSLYLIKKVGVQKNRIDLHQAFLHLTPTQNRVMNKIDQYVREQSKQI